MTTRRAALLADAGRTCPWCARLYAVSTWQEFGEGATPVQRPDLWREYRDRRRVVRRTPFGPKVICGHCAGRVPRDRSLQPRLIVGWCSVCGDTQHPNGICLYTQRRRRSA